MPSADQTWLLADVGGTNTRVAEKTVGMPAGDVHAYRNRDFPSLQALLRHYLDESGAQPAAGALAVASPVDSDTISLTNLDWRFSVEALRSSLGFATLRAFNDFTAVALALPALGADQLEQIGPGTVLKNSALAALGPGTGLGVSGLVPCGNAWAALSGEGGHASLAPATEEESRLFALLQPSLEHVSAEKLLSGPGLIQLYRGLAQLRGVAVDAVEAEAITASAVDTSDPLAVDALAMFFALLGSFAGDVALTLGARGGVYLAGGIVPALVDSLRASSFRERFAAKGRFRDYLEAIPTFVIMDPYPGLTGLGAWVDEQGVLFPEPRIPNPESRST
ncbi:MAG TPA: glucokinase [Gammaproteobacteria bacterium]|nr:glucokinase [Gammaproteobacteria bacterium]